MENNMTQKEREGKRKIGDSEGRERACEWRE